MSNQSLDTNQPRFKNKVYLAGPDVFFKDAEIRYKKATEYASSIGLIALSPFDATPISHIKNDGSSAESIYRGNIGLIDFSDGIIANLNSFRGSEPDSGTVFEVGYAAAKGKVIVGYLDSMDEYKQRVAKKMRVFKDDAGRMCDETQSWVEEMGLPLNLMLSCSVKIVVGDASVALKKMQEMLLK
jgi:nucleoside 2-deoxyribosyltransferase